MNPDPSPTPLDRKTFNAHFDRLLETGQINPEILEHMDWVQQRVINEVKKAFSRLRKKV
jgi:hypothetical protein